MRKTITAFMTACMAVIAVGATAAGGHTYYVDQKDPAASDQGPGTEASPFLTVNHAAQLAGPGDTVMVFSGVYRERICPARGGEPGKPVVYMAAPGQKVYLRGSDVFHPRWKAVEGKTNVYSGGFYNNLFGLSAYNGNLDTSVFRVTNPFLIGFNRNNTVRPQRVVIEDVRKGIDELKDRVSRKERRGEQTRRENRNLKAMQNELENLTGNDDPEYRLALGMVFLNGEPLLQVQHFSDLDSRPGTWITSPGGDGLFIHFPSGSRPENSVVEITTRHTVFSPLKRNLGYIEVRGFVIEHAANHYPSWGPRNWSQAGALSCRSGHHWVIEDNIVRYARSIGIDCGSENEGKEKIEFPGDLGNLPEKIRKAYEAGTITENSTLPGHHLVRNNTISDNGLCGITGIGQIATVVKGNIIERNNRDGNTAPLWEMGGIKFHYFFNGLIEGNLIRNNDSHGIWLDNRWLDTRVTRNVILNNLWSGMNLELGRGPLLVDNNVVAYTRAGTGIYGHDISQITVAHNLLYDNAGYGVWFAYATPRVKPENADWDHRIVNNLILGNKSGGIGLPIPWEMGGNNFSDNNLFMGGGVYLDEGSGPLPVLFQFNNFAHMGKMEAGVPEGVEPMTADRLWQVLSDTLDELDYPKARRPDSVMFKRNFLVPIDIWRTVLGNDTHSKQISVIQDGLQSKLVTWEFDIKDAFFEVPCKPVPGVDKDFNGVKMNDAKLIPGPFQTLKRGATRIVLWPVK